jgi:hypothetical protein
VASIEQLEARVAALEHQSQPPSYAPMNMTVANDGSVGAVFPGGVLIDRQTYDAPHFGLITPTSAAGAVAWQRADSSLAGLVASVREIGRSRSVLYIVAEGDDSPATTTNDVIIRAVSPDGNNSADLAVNALNGSGQAYVRVDNQQVNLLDPLGGSAFVRNILQRRTGLGNARSGAASVAPGTSASLASGFGGFDAGFFWDDWPFFAVLGGIFGAPGEAEFFTWAWSVYDEVHYDVTIHNHHPTATLTATWSGITLAIG